VSTLATLLPLAQAVDAAEEGKHVITGMLIVGLIFIGVIALGETSKWLRHRKHRAYPPTY
jgi:heme/copper-type cytochrome/quinol oxidase subunit 2